MRVGIGFGVLVLLLGACACSRAPDDQRIRAAIGAMKQAMEEQRPRDFLAYVSTDFTGNDGAVDREGLGNLLRAEALRNESIGVVLGPIDVDVQGDRATVHMVATFTGGSGGWLPERGSVYAITSGWKRDGSAWHCYNATWKQEL